MTCIHLQQLFRVCQENQIKLTASDVIRVVCTQCGQQEVCPSMLTDEYDSRQHEAASAPLHQQFPADSGKLP